MDLSRYAICQFGICHKIKTKSVIEKNSDKGHLKRLVSLIGLPTAVFFPWGVFIVNKTKYLDVNV